VRLMREALGPCWESIVLQKGDEILPQKNKTVKYRSGGKNGQGAVYNYRR
jgi:hypothetical protein